MQSRLVELRAAGIFLALVSRNRPEDVERLFAARRDFPLQWEHFSARSIGWADKAGGVADAARALRIGVDSVVFVDDNPGELAAVASQLAGVRSLYAETDAAATLRAPTGTRGSGPGQSERPMRCG